MIASPHEFAEACVLIRIRLGEPFWRSVGERNMEFEIESGGTLRELMTLLRTRYPELAIEMDESPPRIFAGDEELKPESRLIDGSLVRFAWPIAGG